MSGVPLRAMHSGDLTRSVAAALAPGFAAGQLSRQTIDSREYRWRGEDQIAAIIDSARGPRFYDHDSRGALVRERLGTNEESLDRAMDIVGNIYRSADGSDRQYGPGGRLEFADGIRYDQDEDGNQIRKTEPDGSAWAYAWNGHGRLREITRPDNTKIEFEYDALSRRTAKRVTIQTALSREAPNTSGTATSSFMNSIANQALQTGIGIPNHLHRSPKNRATNDGRLPAITLAPRPRCTTSSASSRGR